MGCSQQIRFRSEVLPSDPATVRDLVVSTGFFNREEEDIAVELVDANRMQGAEKSGYYFLFAEVDGRTVAYSCYGPIHGTQESFDLFWIVVSNECRGQGIGRVVMQETERRIPAMGGHRVYVETSSRDQYDPTRKFYLACGYKVDAVIEDFYAPGDGKVILVKVV